MRNFVPGLGLALVPALFWPVMALGQIDIDGFATLDADGDGAITQGEAAATQSVLAAFADLDTNADGALSAEEYAVAAAPPPVPEAAPPSGELPGDAIDEPPTTEAEIPLGPPERAP